MPQWKDKLSAGVQFLLQAVFVLLPGLSVSDVPLDDIIPVILVEDESSVTKPPCKGTSYLIYSS